jgi:hypothetical protein
VLLKRTITGTHPADPGRYLCTICGHRSDNKHCSLHRKIHSLTCYQCGELFTARPLQTICGAECRRRRQINVVLDRHYGFVHSAMREGPLLDYLTKRDHGRCGICHKLVRAVAGDMKPSIDHIQPRSLGGSDELANLQLAHLKCNRQKSNRGHGEQLLLIG